jgi:hypothetical protein
MSVFAFFPMSQAKDRRINAEDIATVWLDRKGETPRSLCDGEGPMKRCFFFWFCFFFGDETLRELFHSEAHREQIPTEDPAYAAPAVRVQADVVSPPTGKRACSVGGWGDSHFTTPFMPQILPRSRPHVRIHSVSCEDLYFALTNRPLEPLPAYSFVKADLPSYDDLTKGTVRWMCLWVFVASNELD